LNSLEPIRGGKKGDHKKKKKKHQTGKDNLVTARRGDQWIDNRLILIGRKRSKRKGNRKRELLRINRDKRAAAKKHSVHKNSN